MIEDTQTVRHHRREIAPLHVIVAEGGAGKPVLANAGEALASEKGWLLGKAQFLSVVLTNLTHGKQVTVDAHSRLCLPGTLVVGIQRRQHQPTTFFL